MTAVHSEQTPSLLFDDQWLAVVQKPAGMPSITLPSSALRSVESAFPGWLAVHRLDNDTSGCLLVAKSRSAFAQLRTLFDTMQIEKIYRARVDGFTPVAGVVTTPIGHHPSNAKRMVIASTGVPIRGQPQAADTRYATVLHLPASATYPLPTSLVDVTIRTGVRHQIRVHFASIGHPLVGDVLYNVRREMGAPRVAAAFTHHLLHAWRLRFVHPWTGMALHVEAPWPEYLQA